MSASYSRMMDVLKRWPLQKSKGNRDYGMHLRNLAKAAFPVGDVFSGTEVEKQQKYEALLRLADNKYGKMYYKHRTTAATGLTVDQLHTALSQEFVDDHFKS